MIDQYWAIVGLLPTSQPTSHRHARANHHCHPLSGYNSHFGISVSMASREYALHVIFIITHLLNSNILKNYDGRIETPWPKRFSSNHCIWRNDTRHELGTAPYLQHPLPMSYENALYMWRLPLEGFMVPLSLFPIYESLLQDHSQTLTKGAWCKKGGGLKLFTLVRGTWKNDHKFPSKNWD